MTGPIAVQTADYGGLHQRMPRFVAVLCLFVVASFGLPATSNFIGEFLILLGVFQTNPLYAVLAASGVVLGAIYMLWMYQRVFHGEITREENKGLKDINVREFAVFAPLILMVFLMGVYSKPFISKMEPSVNKFIEQINDHRELARLENHDYLAGEMPESENPYDESDDDTTVQTAARKQDTDTESAIGGDAR